MKFKIFILLSFLNIVIFSGDNTLVTNTTNENINNFYVSSIQIIPSEYFVDYETNVNQQTIPKLGNITINGGSLGGIIGSCSEPDSYGSNIYNIVKNSKGNCVGALTSNDAGNQGAYLSNIGISKSFNGQDLMFYKFQTQYQPTQGDNFLYAQCSQTHPGCVYLDSNYNPSLATVADAAASGYVTLSNGSNQSQNIVYRVVWGDDIGGWQTTCVSTGAGIPPCGENSNSLNPFTWQKFGLPPSTRINAANFFNLSQPTLNSYDGLINIGVSKSLSGNPIMYAAQSSNKYHYTTKNPTGVKLDNSLMPQAQN